LFGTRHYEAARQQMRHALAQLGLTYPSSRAGVRRAILHYLVRHVVRAQRGRLGLPARRNLDLAVATEMSTILHMMAWSDYFLNKERMFLDSILELHVGETSALTAAEARGLSSVGFGLMTFGARRLARRYHHRAVKIAQRSASLSAIGHAWLALGFLDFYDGRWDDCGTRMGEAAAAYSEAGDLHRWAAAALMRSWIHIARGELAAAHALTSEIVRAGKDAGDPQMTSWGFQNLGRTLLALGPLQEAEAVLREGRALARRIQAWDNLLHLQAMLVRCLVLQGKLEECEALLAEAHHVIRREKMDQAFDRVEVVVAGAVYWVAVVEHRQDADRAAALRQARDACRIAHRCALRMPMWLPTMLRVRGTAEWLSGNAARARRHWQESVETAERFTFPIERALTLMEMGRRNGDAALVSEATTRLRESGANTYIALAQQTLRAPTVPARPVFAQREA
jgi:tetratricopeptide (TPR) repeat protein